MKTVKYYHKNSPVVAYERATYYDGFWNEYTYDKKGNQLTFKDSYGYLAESTYDEKGNVLTYKNSNGLFELYGKQVTKEEFEAFTERLSQIAELERQVKELKDQLQQWTKQ